MIRLQRLPDTGREIAQMVSRWLTSAINPSLCLCDCRRREWHWGGFPPPSTSVSPLSSLSAYGYTFIHFSVTTSILTASLNKQTKYKVVRFEVFTAVTMKNAVFWDIKTQFVLHRRHITSPLQSPAA
jgi:hypothetical protein